MKSRISITLDEETVEILNSLLKDSKYRNRSHVVELAIELLKKEMEKESK